MEYEQLAVGYLIEILENVMPKDQYEAMKINGFFEKVFEMEKYNITKAYWWGANLPHSYGEEGGEDYYKETYGDLN
jgi:hypothetical protein